MRGPSTVFALLISASALCQVDNPTSIEIDQTIAQCEGKWFVADTVDGEKLLGFVYVDAAAGFTFEHYGTVVVSYGKLRALKSELHDKARVIERIGQNFPAACLSDGVVSALGLPNEPETMRHYRDERPPGEHHASWAYHYNHIGASEIALDHVAKAEAAGFTSPELTFEHAFALNALGRFGETVAVVTPLVKEKNSSADLVAELAFAYLNQGEYDNAIGLYKKAIEIKPPSERQWEFAQNIAAAYDRLGEESQGNKWAQKAENYKKVKE